jgi:hypothetical protein
MTYKINKTDGSLLKEILDSEIDQVATDITLIGKNVTGYGEYINENFVKLLENFASTTEPNNPIAGQIWFDLTDNRLKVYDGNGFRVASGPIVSSSQPLTLGQGDFWIDNEQNQLYFNDGLETVLVGPGWRRSDGRSGVFPVKISDNSKNIKLVNELRSGGVLLGYYSSHPEFTPVGISNYLPDTIKPGFNSANFEDYRINAIAASAESLVNGLGETQTADNFLIKNGNNSTSGTLTILNPTPLKLGVNQENEIKIITRTSLRATLSTGTAVVELTAGNTIGLVPGMVLSINVGPGAFGDGAVIATVDSLIQFTASVNHAVAGAVTFNPLSSYFEIRSNWNNQDFRITTRASNNFYDAITVKAANNRVGIFNSNPQSTLDVTGDVVVSGNLTVNGATTTINSTTLTIDDKQIILGSTASPSDATADGGGIVLKGTTDHSITWSNSTDYWNFSDGINIPAGSSIKIDGVDLISDTALKSSITTAAGLNQIGTLLNLQVDNVNINGNTISTNSGSLILNPAGIGVIDASNSRITNVYFPAFPGDAATKGYVDGLIGEPWAEVFDNNYQSSAGQRIFASTASGSINVILPETPISGDTILFLDYDGTFDLTSSELNIVRYRRVDLGTLAGTAASTGSYAMVPTINMGPSSGTGLLLDINVTATGTYTNLTTNLEVVNHGVGYRTNDVIKILGTELGGTSPANDMVFTIRMDNILSADDDLVINDKNAAFGLIYTNSAQGWKYTEQLAIPETILSDLKGNIVSSTTNNVVLDTDSATALFVGNVSGNLTGDVTGNLLGDLTGRVLTAAQPNITSLGTLTGLTVSTAINANLAGNVTGTLFGPVSGASVTAPSGLTLASTLNDIKIRSGKFGIIMSAFDDTGVQNQFAIQVVPGTAPGNRTSTYLYGDVSVVNQTGSNVNGASFKLPTYTNAGLAARSLSLLNYGELIYNESVGKVQAYVAPGVWVDLH